MFTVYPTLAEETIKGGETRGDSRRTRQGEGSREDEARNEQELGGQGRGEGW